ncbi:hypothetical protein K0M31_000782 [Melipona bicolor]|uniref:Uncharacterized protein n=1 Tax=Melipona bicolor TaxID=60889 RepID=A0AA40KXE0_9HYME|nr:hypothetical protein K0M31_000782 [Melipona bicolor]
MEAGERSTRGRCEKENEERRGEERRRGAKGPPVDPPPCSASQVFHREGATKRKREKQRTAPCPLGWYWPPVDKLSGSEQTAKSAAKTTVAIVKRGPLRVVRQIGSNAWLPRGKGHGKGTETIRDFEHHRARDDSTASQLVPSTNCSHPYPPGSWVDARHEPKPRGTSTRDAPLCPGFS